MNLRTVVFLLLFFSSVLLPGQAGLVSVSFKRVLVTINPGDMVSNVLCVSNGTDQDQAFNINFITPGGWKYFSDSLKKYNVAAGDTTYIPIRLFPAPNKIMPNKQYPIIIEIINKNGVAITSATFFCMGPRQIGWDVRTKPDNIFYFRQNDPYNFFDLLINNKGNAEQQIFISLSSLSNNLCIVDSTKKNTNELFRQISLQPGADTSMRFHVCYKTIRRNTARIDIDNYRPRSPQDELSFSMNVHTSESKAAGSNFFSTNNNLKFRKPANILKVNNWGTAAVPMIAELNTYNIMGNIPGANLTLRGIYQGEKDRSVSYFVQQNFTSFRPGSFTLRNNYFTVSYADKKMMISAGNINGVMGAGIPLSGKGVSGLYHIDNKNTVGAFLTRGPGFFGAASRYAGGLIYMLKVNKDLSLTNMIGRVQLISIPSAMNFISSRANYHLKNHNFNASATFTSLTISNTTYIGYLATVGYSSVLLKKKILESVRISFNNSSFSNLGSKRLQIVNRTQYQLPNKLMFVLQNNFNTYYIPSLATTYTIFNNQLFMPINMKAGKLSPGIFYNYADLSTERVHFRGVGLDYSYYSMQNPMRLFSSVRMGYNHLPMHPDAGNFFSLSLFNSIQWKIFTLISRYNYGPTVGPYIYNNISRGKYPQALYLSFQYQYQFKNPCYLIQSNITYSNNNSFNSQNTGIYTDFYFFSFSGWRVRLTLGYDLSIFSSYSDSVVVGTNRNKNLAQNIQIGAGIKKEFGIKLPKKLVKTRFFTITYVAFIDNNGNKIRDRNEVALENVVIKTGDQEVITDKGGQATILNIKMGNYKLLVFPLDPVYGFFPRTSDSLTVIQSGIVNIPFSRAVEISGAISVNRITDDGNPILLDNIRITAVDSLGNSYSSLTDKNGEYKIYVPFGNYTMTVNDMIFGENFVLAQNNVKLDLSEGISSIDQSFIFNERQRKMIKKKF